MKLLFTSLFLILLGVGARAGVVTTLADDGTAGTLRAQIAAAAAGDTITFQAGLHGTITLDPLQGEIIISQSLTIQGPGAGVIAIDGGLTSPTTGVTVFYVGYNSNGDTVSLSGLTIQNGNSLTNGNRGGGILNEGDLELTDCTLIGNHSSMDGGGIYNDTNSTLTLIGCTFTGNSAGVTNNSSGDFGFGGGVFNNSGTLTMTDCTLTGNSAGAAFGNGGGIATLGIATAVVTNCTFSGNSAPGIGGGGGAYNGGKGLLTLTNCTFSGNSANGPGGGVYNSDVGNVTLTNDILYGDTSTSSPSEISNSANSPNTITFAYCDIQGNANSSSSPDNHYNFGADPLFIRNPGTNGTGDFGDLHLQGISPVIGKGSSAAPGFRPTDHDGVPYASPPSLGAFEGQSARDVTALVQLRAGPLHQKPHTDDYQLTVTITNTSRAPISGPISLVLDGLTPDILLTSQSGTTAAGYPYQNALPAGSSLAPGQSVTLVLSLDNDTKPGEPIKCTPRVLAGAGAR